MAERFGPLEDALVTGEGEAGGRIVHVTNPLSSQHSVMRQSLIGSLLEVVSTNTRLGQPDVAIFEIGKGYGATRGWRLDPRVVAARPRPHWRGRGAGLGSTPLAPTTWTTPKGIIELIAESLGFERPTYSALTDDPNLHPGRAARVVAGDRISGRVGEVHPILIDDLELRADRILVAELAIAGLSGGYPSTPRVMSPSRHPIVDRDLAVIVSVATAAADVEASIRRHGGALLRSVTLFDIYRGRPLGRRREEPRLSARLRSR
jgi:phenylalanyl-tRNA synthetase beta chain